MWSYSMFSFSLRQKYRSTLSRVKADGIKPHWLKNSGHMEDNKLFCKSPLYSLWKDLLASQINKVNKDSDDPDE